MSGKNGGIPQIYNIIDGHECHSSLGEWFHVLKAGSDKNVLCAAPRSTMKDVEAARDAAMTTLPKFQLACPSWPEVWSDALKMFFVAIVEEINDGKTALADAAADESGLDRREILEELEKIKSLPTSWGYKLSNPATNGGNLKVISVGGAFEIKPIFYSTIMFSVLYELLNRSAVILLPSRANAFSYYFGKMILNAVRNTAKFLPLDSPFGIFGLVHAKDGKLADEVLEKIITGKLYKVGNGIVVPGKRRKD